MFRASLPAPIPSSMRLRNCRFYFALLLVPAAGAQEGASTPPVRFRSANFAHDMLLRDIGQAAPASFALPPGGHELGLQPTTSTPYDRYFGSVREVIATLEPQRSTMASACHLMKVGFSFQYVTRDPYRPDPPKLTEVQRAGDCKSKALWLYDNLADAGALLTIGKAERNSKTSHAWVYWRSQGRWWILDCTDRTDPIAADTVSDDRYIPYYSFGKNGAYRHPATRVEVSAAGSPAAAVGAADRKKVRGN